MEALGVMRRALAAVMVAWAMPLIGAEAEYAPRDLEVRAFLLEDLLAKYARTNETCYVAFGRNPGGKPVAAPYGSPPCAFLKRFAGRPYSVRPAFAYPIVTGRGVVENSRTGSPDGIYTVEVVEWIDDTTAKVKTSMWRNGLWARGFDAVVERTDGQWRITRYGEMWMS